MTKIDNKRKINNYSFPPEEDLKEIRKEFSDLNYSKCSLALPENANDLDRIKYNICKMIIRYKRENDISLLKLARKIKLSVPETEDVLHYHIHKFTLDRLVAYATSLSIPLQVQSKAGQSSFSRKRI